MRFAEELLLLLLNEDAGTVAVPAANLGFALAGARLMDLAIEGRIDTDLAQLVAVDSTPLGDDLLDPVLTAVAAETTVRGAEFWVRRLAAEADGIEDAVLAQLLDAGILEMDESGMHLSPQPAHARRYPIVDGKAEEEVRLRIMRVLFGSDVPAPRDVVIICLADACGFFERTLSAEERRECAERLGVVRRLDLIGQAVAKAVREATDAARVQRTAAAIGEPKKTIPLASGLPLLGNALSAAKDLMAFLVRSYRRHGPVFRMRLPGDEFVVLAGAQMNRLVHRQGRVFLRTQDGWTSALEEVGAGKIVTSLDGAEHVRLRKALAHGYSRKRFEENIGTAMDICRCHVDAWPQGKPISGKAALQRIVADQLGTILANVSPNAYFDDLTTFLDLLLLTRIAKIQPMFLHRRKYDAAWRRVNELFELTMREHRPGGPLADAGDLVNDVLALHDTDPQFLPETDLLMAAMGPFIAGLDTAAITTSFTLYEAIKRPQLAERLRTEADALFAGGKTPTADALGRLDAMHRLTLEVLRFYPSVPIILRTSSNSFEAAGYRIPAGARVVCAAGLTHHLEEHFPEPAKFDIDRYLPERAEHRQADAYAPFGLGHHRCLAAGFAETQIMLTTAFLMHYAEFELHPKAYAMQTTSLPTLRPKKSFKLRKVRVRTRD